MSVPVCAYCGDPAPDRHRARGKLACKWCADEINKGKLPPPEIGLTHFTSPVPGPKEESPMGENCRRIREGD
jgi:hypothetical protein